MKTSDVNIRDPFVLVYEGKYDLYGTRSATCWGPEGLKLKKEQARLMHR